MEGAGVDRLKKHGDSSIFDIISAGGTSSIENLIKVDAFLEKNKDLENKQDLEVLRDQLHAFLEVKAKIYGLQASLHGDYINKVGRGDKSLQADLDHYIKIKTNFYTSCDSYCASHSDKAHEDKEAKTLL